MDSSELQLDSEEKILGLDRSDVEYHTLSKKPRIFGWKSISFNKWQFNRAFVSFSPYFWLKKQEERAANCVIDATLELGYRER